MNALTIVVLVVILSFGIIGFIRGFFKSAVKLVLTAVSFVLAYFLAPLLANIIINYTPIDEAVNSFVYAEIENVVEKKAKKYVEDTFGSVDLSMVEEVKESFLTQELPVAEQVKFIEDLGVPQCIQTTLIENNNANIRESLGVENFFQYISSYISRMIVNALAFMLITLAFRVLLAIVPFLNNIINSLPFVGTLNRFGGLVFGLLEGLVLVWIFFVFVTLLSKTDYGNAIVTQIQETNILSEIYDRNIFLPIIRKMMH